jgi:hypothetical protein
MLNTVMVRSVGARISQPDKGINNIAAYSAI